MISARVGYRDWFDIFVPPAMWLMRSLTMVSPILQAWNPFVSFSQYELKDQSEKIENLSFSIM